MSNKELHIDKEAVATLAMVKEGLLSPVTKLMCEKEAQEVDSTKKYKGKHFPFSFLLAPSGKINAEVLQNSKAGEKLTLICNGDVCGELIVNETFEIDIDARVKRIYGTNSQTHPGVQDLYRRLGKYAVCGEYTIDYSDVKEHIEEVNEAVKAINAKSVSTIMLSGKPFHRVHERLIRTALVKCDLMVIFLLKPFTNDFLSYETRKKSIEYFIENFLPKNKVVLVPLENTYIFAGFNELLLNSIVAKNFGCDKLIIGQNHAGLGAFYDDKEHLHSIVDTIEDIDIEIMSEFVYCDKCKTLVSTNACPHGRHHHVSYHTTSILDMLQLGIMPPAILMRKEISSIILSSLFPERSVKLANIRQDLFPSSGILDGFKDSDFYDSLMDLYQTSSLT